MGERERIAERLRAYIRPNEAETEAQQAAFERAVDAQLEWEQRGGGELPLGVTSLSIGSYSVTAAEASGAACTRANLSPAAWAVLTNAGLLARAWPVAQRL